MEAEERPYEPPMLTRAISSLTLGGVGFLCRSFLFALSRTEVHGLDNFLELLDERKDPKKRERGLITGMLWPLYTIHAFTDQQDSLESCKHVRTYHEDTS